MSADRSGLPEMYTSIADWWPLLSAPSEYAEEAAFYAGQLERACRGPAATLLEIGSGGGNNASHLKQRFTMTLVELAPGMIEVSRRLNPELEHVQGDMRSVRLDRAFDCVFIHDAIAYMTTEADLRRAIETAAIHCRAGGAVLLAPDCLKDTFRPSTECGGNNGDRRAARYLEWKWDPDPGDSTYVADYVYALRDPDGSVRVVQDRHVEGLFARADWLRLMDAAGFDARAVRFDHSELEPGTYEVFVGTRRG